MLSNKFVLPAPLWIGRDWQQIVAIFWIFSLVKLKVKQFSKTLLSFLCGKRSAEEKCFSPTAQKHLRFECELPTLTVSSLSLALLANGCTLSLNFIVQVRQMLPITHRQIFVRKLKIFPTFKTGKNGEIFFFFYYGFMPKSGKVFWRVTVEQIFRLIRIIIALFYILSLPIWQSFNVSFTGHSLGGAWLCSLP